MANDNDSPPTGADDPGGPAPRRRSLLDQDVSQLRNEQRSGGATGADPRPGGPEGNDMMREIWSQPGGEANNYRNAMVGAGTKADDHSDLVAAETPETHRHLSDASLPPRTPEAEAGDAAQTLGQPEGGAGKP